MQKITNTIILSLISFLFIFFSIMYYAEPYDESFISYRIARHVAQGHGFCFNIGEDKVEGFSNFLWVILLSLTVRFGLNVVQSSIFLSLWFSLATVWLVYRIAQRFCGRWALAAPLFVIFTDFFLVNSLNGLETTLFTFLLFVTYVCFLNFKQTPQERIYLVLAALTFFLLSITRPEGPLFILPLSLMVLFDKAKSIRMRCIEYLWFVVPFSVLYIIYFIWRYIYFGYFFPNTYYARQLILFPSFGKQLATGLFYCFTFCLDQAQIAGVLLLLPLIVTKTMPREIRFSLLIIVTYIVFIITAGGDWNHLFGTWRFMVPLIPFFGLLFAAIGCKRALGGKSAAALILSFLVLSHTKFTDIRNYPDYINFEMARRKNIAELFWSILRYPHQVKYQVVNFLTNQGLSHIDGKAGKWLKEHYPRDILLASQQEGRLAFFADLKFLDIDGIVSETIAHLELTDYRQKKHLDYLFKARPDIFIFPVSVLKYESALPFSSYLKKNNYALSKVFCPQQSVYIFDVYQKMYADPQYAPPDQPVFYFLCLFERKEDGIPKSGLKETKDVTLFFEDEWYSIEQKDLIVL